MTCAEFLRALTTQGANPDLAHADDCERCADALADLRAAQQAAAHEVIGTGTTAASALGEARRALRTTRVLRGISAFAAAVVILSIPIPSTLRVGTEVHLTPTAPDAARRVRSSEVRAFVGDRARHYFLALPSDNEVQLDCFGCGDIEAARFIGALQDRFPDLAGPVHVSPVVENRAANLLARARATIVRNADTCVECPDAVEIGRTRVPVALLAGRPEVVAFRLATRTGASLTGEGPSFQENPAPYTPGATRSVQAPEVASAPPILGDPGAPVRILVFTDLTSAAGAGLEATLRTLVAEYHGSVALEFRHFWTTSDTLSEAAARTLIAAGEQGKFWAMHDRLIEGPSVRSREELLEKAGEIGLDVAQVEASLKAADAPRALERDLADASALDVLESPTMFVNGVRIDGPRTPGFLRRAVEVEMAYASLAHRSADDPEVQALPFLVSGLFEADAAPCRAADALRHAMALAPPCSLVRDGAQRELAVLVQAR